MITILVVGVPGAEASQFAVGHPSVEILVAGGTAEALEKLARNRRIDAVLVLSGTEAVELATILAEEDPAAPPLFAPAAAGTSLGVRTLPASQPDGLLGLLVHALRSAEA